MMRSGLVVWLVVLAVWKVESRASQIQGEPQQFSHLLRTWLKTRKVLKGEDKEANAKLCIQILEIEQQQQQQKHLAIDTRRVNKFLHWPGLLEGSVPQVALTFPPLL